MIAVVVAVVVVAGVVAFFLLRKGGGPEGTRGVSPGPGTPSFNFQVRATKVIPTVPRGSKDDAEATQATKDIGETLSRLYGLAFLDPDRWQSGDYGPVFGFFQPGKVAAVAKHDEAVLTLGPKAGATFTKVEPTAGSLVVRILTDRGNKPFTATATADFAASGTQKDGKVMVIKSHATYYLQSGSDGWVVIGFSAARHDHTKHGAAAPTGGTTT